MPGTVPWDLLENVEQSTSLLEDASITLAFPNLNPDKMEFEELFKFAKVVSSADHGLTFRKLAQ